MRRYRSAWDLSPDALTVERIAPIRISRLCLSHPCHGAEQDRFRANRTRTMRFQRRLTFGLPSRLLKTHPEASER